MELARLAAPAVDVYPYHVWLGRFLTAAGRDAEGEAELRRAVAFPDAGWDATAALAAYLAQHNRKAEAEAAVEALRASCRRVTPRCRWPMLRGGGPPRPGGTIVSRSADETADDGPTLLRVAAFDLRLNRAARGGIRVASAPGSGRDLSAADRRGRGENWRWCWRRAATTRKIKQASDLLAPEAKASAADRRGAGVRAWRPGRRAARRRCVSWKKKRRRSRCRPTSSSARATLRRRRRLAASARSHGRTAHTGQTESRNIWHISSTVCFATIRREAGPWIARLATLEPARPSRLETRPLAGMCSLFSLTRERRVCSTLARTSG